MKKRYLISAGIMAASIGLVLGVLAMLPPSPGITRANLNRVQVGMTLAEVEAILGKHKSKAINDHMIWAGAERMSAGYIYEFLVIVHFEHGRVIGKECPHWPDETFFQMALRVLRLRQ